jgi:hypothetical protein
MKSFLFPRLIFENNAAVLNQLYGCSHIKHRGLNIPMDLTMDFLREVSSIYFIETIPVCIYDIALTFQADSFSECEANFETDLERLNVYYCPLQPNPTKTETCVCHLSTMPTMCWMFIVQFANHTDSTRWITPNILESPWIGH